MRFLKHDTDAHADPKIKNLIRSQGLEGYGVYWYTLELIGREISESNCSFSLLHDLDQISYDMRIKTSRLVEILDFMVDAGLLEKSGDDYSCTKIGKRLDQSMTSSPVLRKAISQFKTSHFEDPDELPLKSPKKKRPPFTKPTEEEVREYCRSRKNGIDPPSFVDFYESKNWMVGKNKMQDWKAAVRTWERRDQNKTGADSSPMPNRGRQV